MGSELGKCINCEEWTEVEEFEDGLLCRFCYEDLLAEAKELTEPENVKSEF